MFLIDTNVLSELRRARPHGAVLGWLESLEPDEVSVSAVTIGEVQRGIEITRPRDTQRAEELEIWLNGVVRLRRILAMDDRAFRATARLLRGQPSDHFNDAMIAATALVHGLTVATRNVRDFESFGVPLFDPFAWSAS